MQLDHEFTVPVPVAQAWTVLLDIERIAPCLPGAVIDSVSDDSFSGRVKVKVGPIGVSYAGTGHFLEMDEAAGRVRIGASGKETRGSGTAKATISAQLYDQGASTRVSVQTELNITGKPAQFGRGVMVDVGNKLLDQFANCLAEQLGTGSTRAAATAPSAAPQPASQQPAATATAATAAPAHQQQPVPIDLLGTAGLPILKRVAPIGGALALLVLLIAIWRRRR